GGARPGAPGGVPGWPPPLAHRDPSRRVGGCGPPPPDRRGARPPRAGRSPRACGGVRGARLARRPPRRPAAAPRPARARRGGPPGDEQAVLEPEASRIGIRLLLPDLPRRLCRARGRRPTTSRRALMIKLRVEVLVSTCLLTAAIMVGCGGGGDPSVHRAAERGGAGGRTRPAGSGSAMEAACGKMQTYCETAGQRNDKWCEAWLQRYK